VLCHTTPSSEFAPRSADYVGQVKHTLNSASFASRFQACYDGAIKNEAFAVAVNELLRYRFFYSKFCQSQANTVSTIAIFPFSLNQRVSKLRMIGVIAAETDIMLRWPRFRPKELKRRAQLLISRLMKNIRLFRRLTLPTTATQCSSEMVLCVMLTMCPH